MNEPSFPNSQRELLLAARGRESQAAFAKKLGVDRTCLSRYEREQLGAPTAVINYCLRQISDQLHSGNSTALQEAILFIRRASEALDRAAKDEAASP